MNEVLLDSFRHNSWATRELITYCRPLTDEQLSARGVGTYGDVVETLVHIIRCDGSYAGRMADRPLDWVDGERTRDWDRLDGLGLKPPDVQAWECAWRTGRIWDHQS